MRKIKYILLIFAILLFAGCSGNYNLTINKDLTVNEELNILINNDETTYETTLLLFDQADIDSDKYEVAILDDEVNIKYKEKYSSFEDFYLNSKLYKTLFDNLEYSIDNKGLSLNTKSNFKLDDNDNQNIVNSYDIDELKINIKTPFYVKENNADSNKDNTYTWILNKDDTFKDIKMDLSYKTDTLYGIVILSLIGIATLAILIYAGYYIWKNQRI